MNAAIGAPRQLNASLIIKLRMGDFVVGREMLEKVSAMDSADRIGARALLAVLDDMDVENQSTALEIYR